MVHTPSTPATHGIAELEPGVRIHYVLAGTGPKTIMLLHGYPQTWWEFRHVIGPLVQSGWRVIVPDYRGAGGSSKPNTGYDKRTMAKDLYRLLTEHLKIATPIHLVGHGIGMMVAFAFASDYAKAVEKLILMEAPLPGTLVYDALLMKPKLSDETMWHFHFHNAQNNLAESLTAGRERLYLQHFYDRLAVDSDAGGLRAVPCFDRDAEDNRAALTRNGRLKMPILALGGTSSFYLPIAKGMLSEVAKDVTVHPIPECGHWIAEENPSALTRELGRFCS